MKRRTSVVITDLDNTLYDWVEMWGKTFSTLLDGLVQLSGIPQSQLEREIKTIHERHGTSEYSWVIQEIPSLRRKHANDNLGEVYADVIRAAGDSRRRSLQLYPGVEDTLKELKRKGTLLVGYTESLAFYTYRRVNRLGLDGLLDVLYSPPDHPIPPHIVLDQVRAHPDEYYKPKLTHVANIPEGEIKPSPEVLMDIMAAVGAVNDSTIYVGDSLMKDVMMAQDANVCDVHAAYGHAQHRTEYELLRRVTHWTHEAVEREKEIDAERHVVPTYVLTHSFAELRDHFQFVEFS